MGDGKWEDGTVRDPDRILQRGWAFLWLSFVQDVHSRVYTILRYDGRVRVNSTCEVMTACPSNRRNCGERLQAYIRCHQAFLLAPFITFTACLTIG